MAGASQPHIKMMNMIKEKAGTWALEYIVNMQAEQSKLKIYLSPLTWLATAILLIW